MNEPYQFSQNQPVDWVISPTLKGKGVVVGAATTPLPVMGRQYMIKVTDGSFPNETYPFDTLCVSEIGLRKTD